MVVQYLTIQAERNQHLMISALFLIFIVYSLYSALFINLLLTISLIVLLSFNVYFFLKKQLKNKTLIQIQIYERASKQKFIRNNLTYTIVPFIIYSMLTLLHFLIVYFSENSLMPLVYDYGLGGVLALGLSFYLNKNWNFGICEEGLVIGSKFDSKLIVWEQIKKVHYNTTEIVIEFKKGYPLSILTIDSSVDKENYEKLLKYKFKNIT